MLKRWAGPLVTALIFGGIALVVVSNLDLKGSSPSRSASSSTADGSVAPTLPGSAKPAGFREYPIGDPVEQNKMRIAAVWLAAIQMDGMAGPLNSDLIHLEADIKATAGNPNGFALDEFIPYMEIAYKIFPAQGDKPIHSGKLMPMVAADGLHYGASVAMPEPGDYRLVLNIKPPSAGGLGRHSDPASGVAPWWEPFEVSFDWDYRGLPKTQVEAPAPTPGG